jgi:hypothetical protein
MTEAAERAAHVAGDGADVCAPAAFGLEHRRQRIRHVDEFEPVDLHGTRFELDGFTLAREIVSALAVDLDRREGGWSLHDLADEGREECLDRITRRRDIAAFDDLTFRVVGIGFGAPSYGEAIGFLAVDRVRDRFGRLAERDRQDTRGEWIERAGVARLLRLEQPAHLADGLRRRHPDGLVEDDPAIDGIALLAPCQFIYSPFTSRRTLSLSRRRSMRVASSKLWSSRKKISGAYFRFTGAGDFTTDEFLAALERGDHRRDVVAAERHHIDDGPLEVGATCALRGS